MKSLCTILIALALVFVSTEFAQTGPDNGTAKIRDQVQKFANKRHKVSVTTKAGERFKGVVTDVKDNGFSLSDTKHGTTTFFEYTRVERVKKSGGLSTGAIVALVAGGTAAIIVLALFHSYCNNEGC